MKNTIIFVLLALFCVCGYAQIIDPVLLEEMGQRRSDDKVKVFVIMRQQYDQQQLNLRAAHFTTRAARREFVVNELKQFAEASQYDLRRTLTEMQRGDMVSEPQVLWIANAIYFEATREAVFSIAERSDIMVIGLDEERNWLPDGEDSRPADPTREITSNVTQVNANQVWNLGYTGQGVVVAVIDTGVNYNHLDLADHLWDGGPDFPYHGYDVYNNDNNPMDDHGHGTHCAGTVCGDGTAGSQTGMAPDATLMCVKCLNSAGQCNDSHVIRAMQWAVNHGCDIISLSLGGHGHSGAEQTLIRNTCVNVLNAGVIASIAAGNEGDQLSQYPIPNNVGLPGGCPPPYLDPQQALNPGGLSCSVCVGAVNSNDQAAYFTSNGPCDWSNSDYADYPYTEGSSTEFGLIRPDVCAPGVYIKSADFSSNDGYSYMSGTSMATPCVAGCMALMLSKDINAIPSEICQILEETAVPLSEGKSNIFGYGRVDALAAVNALDSSSLTLETFTVNDTQGNNDGQLNAGESVSLDLTLLNDSDVALDGATLVLSTPSDKVVITNGTATLPYFDAGQTQTIEDVFAFTLSDDALGNDAIRFFAEVFVNGASIGIIRFSVIVYGYILRFDEVAVLNDTDGDGFLEAGETADLHVVVSNTGNILAPSIMGILSTAYPHLTINNNATGVFGNIEVYGQASADFNVTFSSEAPDVYLIHFSLDLVDENETHSQLDFELSKGIIVFADANVKSLCVVNWDTDGDGELSYDEAATVTSLGEVFRGNTAITSFDELRYFTGLDSIGEMAFYNCQGLTSITLPNAVTTIGDYAFCDCISLAGDFIIPDAVTTIGEYAFYYCSYCSRLTSVSIGNSLISVGFGAFGFCNINAVYYRGNIHQWCNIQFDFDASNPLHCAHNLFIDNELVTNLAIPETVTKIKAYTFCGARCLTSLTIPNSVTSIGSSAFKSCTGLIGELVIPNSVTAIGSYAFDSCTGLIGELVIPNSVTAIGSYAFCGCTGFTGSLAIPNSVTFLGSNAFFNCSGLTTITISNSVTSIGSRAFDSCEGLTTLTIGNSVTSIGSDAFKNCNSLYAVHIGDIGQWCNISFSGYYSNPLYYAHNLYVDNELVTDLVIPETVTEIKSCAFYNATCLTSLTISNSVTTIGWGAFSNCTGLMGSLTIPNSVTSIDGDAFYNCTGLTGSLTIPNSVTAIGGEAFCNCTGLISLTIGHSVTSIGSRAFHNCQAISIITSLAETPPTAGYLGSLNSNTIVCVPCGYEEVYASQSWGGFSNFQGMCGGTVTVAADPEEGGAVTGGGTFEAGQTCTVTATALEGYAFAKWTLNGLMVSNSAEYTLHVAGDMALVAHFMLGGNIVFADSLVKSICVSHWDTNGDGELSYAEATVVTNLGDYFKNNSEITSFDELQYFIGLSSICDYAFENCTNLASLVMPNTITSIGYRAFYNCSGLTGSLTIPNMVTSIGISAFYNCRGLSGDLTIPNSVTSIGSCAFENCSGFTGRLTVPNSVTEIEPGVFMGCSGFTNSLILPNSVTSIGNYAFKNCSGFTSLIIGNSVTSIDKEAFYNCSGFTSLIIGNSVTSIGSYAFYNCSGLTGSLTIPNSVTTIGYRAFYNCQAISFIISLAETPSSVGGQAFGSWGSNTVVYVPCGFEDAYASLSWGGFSNFHGMCWGTVTVVADPEEGGTVTGGGTFEAGQTCTVTATALVNYTFAMWSLNGQIVSTNTEYTFYVAGDMELVAHFVPNGNIVFADANVKNICVSHWDTNDDGELSYFEAALVTSFDNAFKNNADITSFEELQYFIGLSSISSFAFKDCTGLTGPLRLPNTLTSIEAGAFYNCNGLSGNLVFPNSLTSIENSAFYNCSSLSGNLTLPNSLTSIGGYTFYKCSGLTGTLTLPNSVTSIGDYAFYNCSGLTGVLTLPNSLTSIESGAFANCRGFTGSLTIPDSMTTIGSSAFYNCSGFTGSLTIPNSVTSIGNSAFKNCSSFNGSLTLPNSLTTIGPESFYYCSGFTGNLTIPNSVTSIGYGAFSNCRGFTGNLTIPNSVTSIGKVAFYNFINLESITVLAETPPTIASTTFSNCPQSIPVYVPCGSSTTYQSAAYWNEFTNIQELCSQTQTITLSEGWNWISTYVDITLDDLKSALVDALGSTTIRIKSNSSATTWNGNRWRGEMDWDETSMYKIQVANDCTITLEGLPLVPANHSITIVPGANYIGYPFASGMSLNTAFSGFAISGDKVKSTHAQSSYNGNLWRGNVSTLEPGQGYIYISNSSENRVFTFPTNAK